ncbi:hypothetical protein [Spiroplasma diminutum]|uniref:Uncharacterized protein n=1 Tax=Spiroplasma diminutum CUAS-1 TaxID=1276221 RepID=S5LYV9_9MOLU|nr:hypothetical protein [Spiroplasma diminutum]AGR41731.1 hypothetical protein SDIMI_v3c00270 [Spiroplasma diminutum CUAS-1]
MNYYIKFENNFYNIIDGNTNQIIASFISEADANKFFQSLFSSIYNINQQRQQGQIFNPYINNQQFVPQMGYNPNQINQQNFDPNVFFVPQQQINSGQNYLLNPQQNMNLPLNYQLNGAIQNPYQNINQPYQNPYQNYGQPNINQQFNQALNSEEIQNPIQNKTASFLNNQAKKEEQYTEKNEEIIEQQNVASEDKIENSDFENKNIIEEEMNIFEDQEYEEAFKFGFNDNTLSIDSNLFEDDKMGVIIHEKNNFINNTDDDSLGEISAYKEIQTISKEKDHLVPIINNKESNDIFENSADISIIDDSMIFGLDDIPEFEQDFIVDKKNKSNNDITVEDKTITEIYQENLIPESKVTIKKDDDLIDFGPILEEDEIFSTPRRDAEQDDFENFSLSKKEKKELKKVKKKEELSRKRYQKLLR